MYTHCMRTVIAKWGNSLAIRIPRAFVLQMEVEPGEEVELDLENQRLIIEKPIPTLTELLRGVSPENCHGEIDTGPAVGREIW